MAKIRRIKTTTKKGINILMMGGWKIGGWLIERIRLLNDYMNGDTTGLLNHNNVLHGNEMKARRAIQ